MANPSAITIPTGPIGSIPRPVDLLERVAKGDSEDPELDRLYEEATRYTIERFEAAGSPVVRDGEQRRYHNFATYCVYGLPNTARMVKFLFSDAHTPSPLAARTRSFLFHAVRRLLPRCRDVLRG
jgi:5-methyltetrahydropteroyltriglutamate--homocysteine methyltransferase